MFLSSTHKHWKSFARVAPFSGLKHTGEKQISQYAFQTSPGSLNIVFAYTANYDAIVESLQKLDVWSFDDLHLLLIYFRVC